MDAATKAKMIDLSLDALAATIACHHESADRIMHELVALDPTYCMEIAILAWIDCTARFMKWDRFNPDSPPLMVFTDENDDEMDISTAVPPEVVWSSRIFYARMNGDEDNFYALLSVINDEEKLTWIDLLLQTCAATCRREYEVRAEIASLN